MNDVTTLQELLGRVKPVQLIHQELPTSVITHDSIDEMELRDGIAESPSFKHAAVDNAPIVPPTVEDPKAPDFTTATREEIDEYQEKKRARMKAEDEAKTYDGWPDLTGDVFYSYHTHDRPQVVENVDPARELHKRIVPRLTVTDEHAESRNITRDNPTMARIATMATMRKLREVFADELTQQMQEMEEFQDQRQRARDAQGQLDGLREEAKAIHDEGKPIPQDLVDQVKQAVDERQQAAANAVQVAENASPISHAAAEGIAAAAQAGQEAAEQAAHLPSFGSGLGEGEPVYESPEQAISIAERWANNPDLRAMAELFGRLDKDIRFKRSKRVVGGNEEIVDIQVGDNLARTLPSELALLGDPDTEDEFLARFASGELMEFSTVGEEHAGRGPIIIVLDGSGSMHGERNVWARAVAMCLLHISRLEKRDFAAVEFTGGSQVEDWMFEARRPLDGEQIIDMASHFFNGGTAPLSGMARATQIMKDAPKFRKADIVLVGDGEASFGPEDRALRDGLHEMGVRIFCIGVGGSFRYLEDYAERDGYVVSVADFDLTDPSDATAELATHIS